METAINIGYSCSLLSNAYVQFILDESTPEKISEKMVTFLQDIQVHRKTDPKTRFALIMSGDALIHAIKEPISKQVLKVAHECEAVLCCRVSPKQKSEVVTLVRREVIYHILEYSSSLINQLDSWKNNISHWRWCQ